MKKLLFAMLIGAALAWAFDPDSGSRRRESLRRKLDETGLTKASPPASSSATRSTSRVRRLDERRHRGDDRPGVDRHHPLIDPSNTERPT